MAEGSGICQLDTIGAWMKSYGNASKMWWDISVQMTNNHMWKYVQKATPIHLVDAVIFQGMRNPWPAGPLNQIQGTLKVFNEFLSNPSNVIFQFGTKRSAPARLETIFGLKNDTWKLYKSWASISNKVSGATGIFLCRPKWNDMQSSITDPSSSNTADFSTRIFKAYISWVK